MLGQCLVNILHLNLTSNPFFYQIDHQGNLRGYLQSGINRLASLHHMFTLWEPFPNYFSFNESQTMSILTSSYQMFHQNLFKRFRKINWRKNETYLLTVGYSFSIFHQILTFEDFFKIEQTWCCSQISTRSFRAKKNNSIHWFFFNATKIKFHRTRSIYQNQQNGSFPSYSTIEILSD